MKVQDFFTLAKEKGLTASQLSINKSSGLVLKIYKGQLDNYTVSEEQQILASGIYNGKYGSCTAEKMTKATFPYLVNSIIDAAKNGEKENLVGIFKGSDKYYKKNAYNRELSKISVDDKIALIKDIEKEIYAVDSRITDVETEYQEDDITEEFYNSYGLKLRNRTNLFLIAASVVCKQGDEVKTDYRIYFGSDMKAFDKETFVKELTKAALNKFGGTQVESGKYPTVIKNDVFSSLLKYFVGSMSSEEVQKKSSMLEGKLNKRVASRIVTLQEKPLQKNCFFTYFDAEGVARKNKDLISRGTLKTYLYNRETALKDRVETTANATFENGKIGIGVTQLVLKKKKKTFDEMIAPIEKGVFISDVQGLGTGMNTESGDFSCQAEGYLIENGKLTKPLSLITLSGNLFRMMKDIVDLDDKDELLTNRVNTPDVYIKSLSIGGK